MFHASFFQRLASCVLGCFVAAIFATATNGQLIEVSLNVHYANPLDIDSGGTWEILAKSSADNFGIFGLNLNILNIDEDADNEAPRGNVNGTGPAGFTLLDVFPTAEENEFMLFTSQEPAPSGQQGAFYGVGRFANGAPNWPGKPPGTMSIGPVLTTFSNPQNIPWATGDPFGEPAWASATMFASGTFAEGDSPGFSTGHTGFVFSTIGTTSMFGDTAAAAITTIVRSNFAGTLPGDYNNDGIVDGADFVVWAKGIAAADGNGDTFVDIEDYNLWKEHFGESTGPGAGGGAGAAVPEPACALLVVFGAVSWLTRRPKKLT
jgi:hypothetical protein